MKQTLALAVIAGMAATTATANCNMIDTINANDPAQGAAAVAQCFDQGGDPNRADRDGWSPLHWAVVTANPKAAQALIERGADINARDDDNATPVGLISPTSEPQTAIALLRVFAAAGADLNAEDDYKETPLSFAAGFNSGTPMVRELLRLGADPNYVQGNGRTALFSTIQGDCRSEIGTMLLDAGADPMRMDAFDLDLFATGTRILCTEGAQDQNYRDRIAKLING